MGVSGSGKTTIAQRIHELSGFPYAEADDFHPVANKEKMSWGIPLEDEDRWPWLEIMRDWAGEQAAAGHSTVITCSALKHSYRELLRQAQGRVVFFELDAGTEVLTDRMAQRAGHFMPTSLLESQLRDLQPLRAGELGRRLDATLPPGALTAEILHTLNDYHKEGLLP
ncbi:gluconokinase [Corynebacterium pacaense]|uniref:gluconokinase n=1 Tax=Corynebacterium pacaense TaxID=1816684 RepID=UPI0009B94658|nr:gluconokinase [Corynebacterium pacaense]